MSAQPMEQDDGAHTRNDEEDDEHLDGEVEVDTEVDANGTIKAGEDLAFVYEQVIRQGYAEHIETELDLPGARAADILAKYEAELTDSDEDEENIPEIDFTGDPEKDRKTIQKMYKRSEDSDEDDDTVPRTKNELPVDKLPPVEPIENIRITEDDKIELAGYVSAKIDALLVIQGPEHSRPLEMGSVLCLANRKPIGRVDEVFGPVEAPMYSVRIDPLPVDVKDELKEEVAVYFPLSYASFVLPNKIADRGTDASNMHDEEVARNEEEYSDDEEEAKAKAEKKRAKKKGKEGATPMSTDVLPNEGNTRQPQRRPQNGPSPRHNQQQQHQQHQQHQQQNFAGNQAGMPFPPPFFPNPYGMMQMPVFPNQDISQRQVPLFSTGPYTQQGLPAPQYGGYPPMMPPQPYPFYPHMMQPFFVPPAHTLPYPPYPNANANANGSTNSQSQPQSGNKS